MVAVVSVHLRVSLDRPAGASPLSREGTSALRYVCINRKRGARSIDLPPAELLLEGPAHVQYFISPKGAKFQPFQRQETPLNSVTEKLKSADILQEVWGDLFPWSSTFSQFHAVLPNPGLQMRHAHLSPQPTPGWCGDYVNQEFETFNKNQLFPSVSTSLSLQNPGDFHSKSKDIGTRREGIGREEPFEFFPYRNVGRRWTRSSCIPCSRQEHPSANKWAVCVMEYPQPTGSAVGSLSALPEQHPRIFVNMQPLIWWCGE